MEFCRRRITLVTFVVCLGVSLGGGFLLLYRFQVAIAALYPRQYAYSYERFGDSDDTDRLYNISLLARSALSGIAAKTRILLFTHSVQLKQLPRMACDLYQVPREMVYYLRPKRGINSFTSDTRVKNLTFQRIRSALRHYDVVIFHVLDMPLIEDMRKLSNARAPHQKFVIYTKESPYNVAGLSSRRHDGIFDWMVNYKRDADIFAPYGRYKKLQRKTARNTLSLLPRERTKLAVWIVSHCGELRDGYIRKLQRHMRIDVIGRCSRSFDQPVAPCTRSSDFCENELKKYKFSFAFENSFCVDYVTEKYWDALHRGSIPVVLGGSDYNNKIAIPGSFINARDFNSSEALALYLQGLASTQAEYMKYHDWRSEYELDYDPKNRHRLEYVLQDLCDLAITGSANGTRRQLSKYYSVNRDCKLQLMLQKQKQLVW